MTLKILLKKLYNSKIIICAISWKETIQKNYGKGISKNIIIPKI